jgi:hypothetical protein
MGNTEGIVKNFGQIKECFNDILIEGIVTKSTDKNKLFKKYVSLVNENKILKTQFLVYNNIENKVEPDVYKATQFVNESIALLSKYKKKDIMEANKKLVECLSSFESENERNDLHENISKLVFTPRTPDTIDVIVEATSKIVDYITKNKEKEVIEKVDMPNSIMTAIMVERYNQKYANLDESEKNILKSLIDSDDEQKLKVYESIVHECIGLINEKYDGAELEEKHKLLMVKERLLTEQKNVDADYFKKISKLTELRNTLKNN